VIEEVWLIRGSAPVLWTIPFWINFEEERSETATMFSAIPLLRPHLEAVKTLLAEIATYDKAMWTINRMDIERIGARVDMTTGVEIEELFTWERRKSHQIDPAAREARKDIDEFLDSLYQTGLPISRDWLGVIYHQICTHALDWLINKERPLDLYFVKLHNCPFRMDWKEWMARLRRFRCKYGSKDLTRRTETLRLERWIEVEPAKLWINQVKRVEDLRVQQVGWRKYATYVSRASARFDETSRRIYDRWVENHRRAPRPFIEGRRAGNRRRMQAKARAAVRARKRSRTPGWSCLASVDTPYEGSWRDDVWFADIEVSQMSALQCTEADVWHRWANLQGTHFGGVNEPGVLVLYATEVGNSMQLLGAQRRTRDWLARRPEQLSRATAEDLNKLVTQP
jgi:hypothetical protein